MHNADPNRLSDRIAGLERRVQRLATVLWSGAIAVLALPLLAFATRPDGVVASKFTLVDERGGVRGVWEARAAEGGDPRLEMRNGDGKKQLDLSVTRQTAMVVLRDEQEHNRVGMAVEGFPHLLMHDAGQKPRIHMTVGKGGGPTLLFIHADGTFPGGIGVEGDGTPWIKPDAWMTVLGRRGERAGADK